MRDGKFQFTVTSVTSAKSAGDSVLSQTAQGQYTVVHITVTNISNVAQTMDDSAQYVYDSQGRKFSADSTADLYANGTADSVFLNQINPGNSVHGRSTSTSRQMTKQSAPSCTTACSAAASP